MNDLEFFQKLRTCPEVDAFFRQGEGTALSAAKAGVIKAARRQWRGRTCYLLDPRDAWKLWGPR